MSTITRDNVYYVAAALLIRDNHDAKYVEHDDGDRIHPAIQTNAAEVTVVDAIRKAYGEIARQNGVTDDEQIRKDAAMVEPFDEIDTPNGVIYY